MYIAKITGSQDKNQIKKYISILDDICTNETEPPSRSDKTQSALLLINLREENFISFEFMENPNYNNITITPKGALALVEWKNYLYENSLTFKIIKNLSKALWVLLGALVAYIPHIFSFFNS